MIFTQFPMLSDITKIKKSNLNVVVKLFSHEKNRGKNEMSETTK